MLCEDVTDHLPGLVDGEEHHLEVEAHVEQCLRCQAEVARYRKLVRATAMLRTRRYDPGPEALDGWLAAIEADAERGGRGLQGRKLVYASAIGGTMATVATAATVAAWLARGRRGGSRLAG